MELSRLKPEDVEAFIGIKGYATSATGIGGVIKERPEDFKVWEVLRDGTDARLAFEDKTNHLRKNGFTIFVLRKVNVTTLSATSAISRFFGVKSRDVGICGIKDKRTAAWQFFSIPYVNIKLYDAPVEVMKNVWVKPIAASDRELSTDDLVRNEFEIKISRISVDSERAKELVSKIIEELRVKGVLNFFGHQRFGILRPITHVVGKFIIKGELGEAVERFLFDYSNFEPEVIRLARKELAESRDILSTMNRFPRCLTYERNVMLYLIRNPKDYAGALRRLPLRLRRLFVEAYSSYLFNKLLSKLMDMDLREPKPGDLVVELDMYGLQKGKPFYLSHGAVGRASELIRKGMLTLVLPVPGYRINLPRNEKATILNEVLEEEGVSLSDFSCRALPEVSMLGDYRSTTVSYWAMDVVDASDGNVSLRLSLTRGSYATVILREIMKSSIALNYEGIPDEHAKKGI